MVHEPENSEEDEFTVKVEDSKEDSKEDELAVEVDCKPDELDSTEPDSTNEPDSTDEHDSTGEHDSTVEHDSTGGPDSTADECLPPFFGLPTPLLVVCSHSMFFPLVSRLPPAHHCN